MAVTTPDNTDFTRVRFVLVGTTHPGNIGATARAMKVMGFSRLHLVNPKMFPHADATAMASGADDVLGDCRVHADLTSALSGCGLVLGSSARLRSLSLPQMDARAAARQAALESSADDSPTEVAVLFGQERAGLDNEQIQRCHYLVHIPTNPDYSSLNLAQAVQVMAYELRMALLDLDGMEKPPRDWVPVGQEQMEYFYDHLEQTLLDIGFLNPDQPKMLMARLRRLFNRARPDQNEINSLRGWLSATAERKSGDE